MLLLSLGYTTAQRLLVYKGLYATIPRQDCLTEREEEAPDRHAGRDIGRTDRQRRTDKTGRGDRQSEREQEVQIDLIDRHIHRKATRTG